MVLSEVGPVGCLNGIGAGAVAFLSGELFAGGGAAWGFGDAVDERLGEAIVDEKNPRELARVGVGGAGCFREREGLSSSEPESHASSSAQSAVDCAEVMIEKWDEGLRPRWGLAGGAVISVIEDYANIILCNLNQYGPRGS
jgi:hypothetical protein